MANQTGKQQCARCSTPVPGSGSLAGLCPRCLIGLGAVPPDQAMAGRDSMPSTEDLQKLIPQLEVLHMIGRGGMGAVYKARQPDLDRHVALKVLRPELADDPSLSDRFVREARTLASLDHPSIVHIHDFGKTGELYYLVMAYVDGSTLRELIDGRLLSMRDCLEIVPEICDALQYAHESGVVHRDIKPANILVDSYGRVKVADFGLSKMLRVKGVAPTLTMTGQAMGTPSYMAPEQMRRTRDVDHRADIFSIGVLLYEMLTGELPVGRFEAPSRRADVDPRLDAIVMKALDRDPDRRYQHAGDLAAEVEAIRENPAAAARTPVAPLPVASPAAPPERRADPERPPSIPFSVTDNVSQATGLVTLDGEELVLEYRKIWIGIFPRKIARLRVPLSEIQSAEVVSGIFGGTQIRLVPRSMAPFEGLPCGAYDIRLSAKGRDGKDARALVQAIRRGL